ncbi:MAG: SDR family oxidoreductase [Planctomycetota bacterium]
MDLAGKRALVTAGAKRIGRGICEALAAAGARVAIHYRSSEAEARETAKACPGAIVLQADLTGGSAACRDLIERAEAGLGGGLDVLVNNAAIYERLALDEIDDAAWDRHLDLNLKATFFLALHAGLGMRDRGAGAIVNLGDWAALRGYPGYLPYFASKAGVLGVTAALARELAPSVRVNTVAPGPIVLPDGSPAKKKNAAADATLVGRLGGTKAASDAVLALLHNDFITGETLVVDGGRSLR